MAALHKISDILGYDSMFDNLNKAFLIQINMDDS